MDPQRVTRILNRLLCLCGDSETGFQVAAENISNRGLKMLLKAYAQERVEFAQELAAAIRQLDGEPSCGGSLLAALHRGWIDLKAAMIIGPLNTERIVLDEVLRGERVAQQAYRRALEAPLSQEIHDLLTRQHQQIEKVIHQVTCLRGTGEERLVVRLFDTPQAVALAKEALLQAGFDAAQIDTRNLDNLLRPYQPQTRRSTIFETVLAAVLLGLALGALLGTGVGLAALAWIDGGVASLATFILRLAPYVAGGALVGTGILAMIGLLIGLSIAEEDQYLYNEGVHHGRIFLQVLVHPERAPEAARIMQGVNAADRSAAISGHPA